MLKFFQDYFARYGYQVEVTVDRLLVSPKYTFYVADFDFPQVRVRWQMLKQTCGIDDYEYVVAKMILQNVMCFSLQKQIPLTASPEIDVQHRQD